MESVNKWLTLTANLGVIAGIIFLAVELSQNNELLEAQARAVQQESRISYTARLLDGVDLATIQYKANLGEALTPLERNNWLNFAIYNFIQWEWQYREFEVGILPFEDLPIGGWRTITRDVNGQVMQSFSDAWELYSSGARSSRYVRFINENVFNQ